MEQLFSIEGNIGAGKSTVLELIREMAPTLVTCPEPLDEWAEIKTESGDTILEAFYKDQKTHAFTFQTAVLLSKYKQLLEYRQLFPNAKIVQERSFLGDFDTFVRTLDHCGHFNRLQLQVYINLFKHFKAQTPVPVFFLIDTPPSICYERIQQRARPGEQAITLQYLQSLHHNIYLLLCEFVARVHILDGLKPPRELAAEIIAIINQTPF